MNCLCELIHLTVGNLQLHSQTCFLPWRVCTQDDQSSTQVFLSLKGLDEAAMPVSRGSLRLWSLQYWTKSVAVREICWDKRWTGTALTGYEKINYSVDNDVAFKYIPNFGNQSINSTFLNIRPLPTASQLIDQRQGQTCRAQ